jgi:hypothetical protein
MHVRADTPIAPTTFSRGEALSILSAGIAGPCCGEANEMLAWLYLLTPSESACSDTGADPPADRPRLWLGLCSLFRT